MKKSDHFRHGRGIKGAFESADGKKRIEIVLKCDSVGSLEAVTSSIEAIQIPGVAIALIHSGVGAINKSDLLMAPTGSRLVIGFNVDLLPKIEKLSKEQGVEVRLFDVIYKLTEDLRKIANSWIPSEEKEKITGKAEVIALFPSSRKGMILGCDVLEGALALGKKFRLITAMGPVYTGKIESLHIEKDAVKEAKVGQRVGLKIPAFKGAKVGDLVECYERVAPEGRPAWQPRGGIFVP